MKRVVFVTGGANGIGRAIVEHFAGCGDSVVFCDVDCEAGEAVARRCGATFYEADLRDAERLTSVLDDVVARFGGMDVIINNVGVSKFTPLAEISIEEFDSVMATNLRPAFLTSRYLARQRDNDEGRRRYGRIINIASTRYLQSEPHAEAYAASKGGIVALTHALAVSLAEYNITVNSISPGWIDTGHCLISEADHKQHPSQRVGRPEDVARMCGFLCAEENDFINGENITLDGGMTKRMIYLDEE